MALSNNVKIGLDIEVAKTTKDLDKLVASTESLTEALKTATKGTEQYNDIQEALTVSTARQNELLVQQALDYANSAQGVGELNKAMKQLKSAQELVDKSSPQFDELQKSINVTEDRVGGLNDEFKTLTGSGFERFQSSIGLAKEGISGLDWSKFSTGIKGATKAFGGLKAALASLGIGLIISAVSYLIENFDDLKNSSGILGKALSAIGDIISAIGDALEWLADKLGIIDLAQEKRVELAEESLKKEKEAQTATEERYDAEIGYAKAAGKNTFELEQKKSDAVQASLKAQADGVKALAELNGKFTEDQIKQYSDLLKAVQKSEIEEKTNAIKHNKELLDDEKKKHEESVKKHKEASDKKTKQLEDEKKKAEELAKESLDDLNKSNQIELIGVEVGSQKYIDIKKRQNDEEYALQKANAEKLKLSGLDLELFLRQTKQETFDLQKKLDAQIIADAEKKVADDKAKAEEIKANNIEVSAAATEQFIADQEAKAQLVADNSVAEYDAQAAILEARAAQALENEQLTADQKLAINQKLDQDLQALELQRVQANLAISSDGLNAIQGLSDAFFAIKAANTKKDSAEAEKNAKKQFQINKALQLGGAIIDGAKAITASLAVAPLAIGPIPNPAGIAALISVAASTAATIAKIAATQYQSSGGGGGGASPAPAAASGGGGGSAPAAPAQANFQAPQFFGLGQGQQNNSQNPQLKATVSVQEINTVQTNVAVSEDRGVQRL